jgi:hypothetical protein
MGDLGRRAAVRGQPKDFALSLGEDIQNVACAGGLLDRR